MEVFERGWLLFVLLGYLDTLEERMERAIMKAFRCFDCKELFKILTQERDELDRLFVTGYCENCNCYTARRVDENKDENEDEDESVQS